MKHTTRNIRVRLDFTIQLPREVSTLPFGGEPGQIHRVLTAAWKSSLSELTPHTLQDGDTVVMLPGGKMDVRLDYRPERKSRTPGRLTTQKKSPAT